MIWKGFFVKELHVQISNTKFNIPYFHCDSISIRGLKSSNHITRENTKIFILENQDMIKLYCFNNFTRIKQYIEEKRK